MSASLIAKCFSAPSMRKSLKKFGVLGAFAFVFYLIWLLYMGASKPDRDQEDILYGSVGRKEQRFKTVDNKSIISFITKQKDTDYLSLTSVREYCNPPDTLVLGDEGEVPGNYKLELVQVIIRHGDRTPIHKIGLHPNPPVSCKFDTQLKNKDDIIKRYIKHLTHNSKRHHPASDFAFWDTFPNEQSCDASKLTPVGAVQHLMNGRNFFYKYDHKWKLFKGSTSKKAIMVKSSEVSRTYQSSLAFMFGFLPKFNFSELIVKKSPTNFCSQKLSRCKCDCPGKMKYLVNSEKFAGYLNRNRVSHIDIRRYLAEVYDLPLEQIPYSTQVMDILMGQACHKIPLKCGITGKCVDKSIVDIIWSLVEEEGIKARMKNKDYLRYSHLSFHPLLNEILQRMINVTKQRTPIRFALYSGHDITLTPFLTLIGIYDGKWPPYASRLSIEMYGRMENGKSHHFIRVVYNGLDVTQKLQFCKTFIDGMCRLKHFQLFAKNHLKLVGISSYNAACA